MSLSAACGRADTADDAGSAEQYEATQYDHTAMSPVEPSCEHHEPDGCNRNHGCDGRDGAEQGTLQPAKRLDDNA